MSTVSASSPIARIAAFVVTTLVFSASAFGSPRHVATPPYPQKGGMGRTNQRGRAARPSLRGPRDGKTFAVSAEDCEEKASSHFVTHVSHRSPGQRRRQPRQQRELRRQQRQRVGLPTKSGGLCWTARFRCIRVSQRRAKQRAKAAGLAAWAAASAANKEEELAAQAAASAAIEEAEEAEEEKATY